MTTLRKGKVIGGRKGAPQSKGKGEWGGEVTLLRNGKVSGGRKVTPIGKGKVELGRGGGSHSLEREKVVWGGVTFAR